MRYRGQRISGWGLHHLISELGAKVGIKTRPHGLRHGSITAVLAENNGDVRAAQQHARHANPQTTMRYDDARKDLPARSRRSWRPCCSDEDPARQRAREFMMPDHQETS